MTTANPYDPPKSPECVAEPPISDDHITRLMAGAAVETVELYDLSDAQVYGRKHRRLLTGNQRDDATSKGFEPVVYQAVYWWCFVRIPVVPLRVYFVLPCIECDDPDGPQQQRQQRGQTLLFVVRARRDSIVAKQQRGQTWSDLNGTTGLQARTCGE